MPDQNSIVTLTVNPSLDISAEIDTLEPEKKMRCNNIRREPGGGGLNVSRAVKKLGGQTRAIFPAGGNSGRSIKEMLELEEIITLPFNIKGQTRENFSILERQSQKQYRFVFPGPEYRDEDRQRCLDIITGLEPQPAYFVASGSLPPGAPADFYGRLAELHNDNETRFILDTSGTPLKEALEKQVYMIKPNRRELEFICDCPLTDEKTQEKVCRELVADGACEIVVLTLGKDGALLTTEKEQVRVPGWDIEVVSAVGAGDSFVGGMVLKLQQGMKIKDAFLYGMAAGTAALTTQGTELCPLETTENFFSKLQQNM